MDENVYMLADGEICRRIGQKIRTLRLRQNITQQGLAEAAQISVSSVKKIEGGEIGTFDLLMRVLRILGELDIFSPLLKEEEISPTEYFEMVEAAQKKRRRRASSGTMSTTGQESSEW